MREYRNQELVWGYVKFEVLIRHQSQSVKEKVIYYLRSGKSPGLRYEFMSSWKIDDTENHDLK